MKNSILPPHGGCGLIDRNIPETERKSFFINAEDYNSYTISNGDLSTFYRIADGTLSPLEGPMDSKEFYKTLDEEIIEKNGKKFAWTIPIAFPVAKKDAKKFGTGKVVAVKNETGSIIGTLEISDIYYFDKARYNQVVYGTSRDDHPGPRIVNSEPRDYLLGGKIRSFPQSPHPLYGKYMLSPIETRSLFSQRKWDRIVAFQTRNPLHRAHEYAVVYAAEKLTKEGFFTGVVINPLVGETKSDDVPADIRMRTYEALLTSKLLGCGDKDAEFWNMKGCDLTDQILLLGIDMKMFYAGPKEAIMHAIYRQNYGFTDIIIGRRHADATFDSGFSLWGDFDAQDKFESFKGQLLIKPLKIGFAAYFEEVGRVAFIEEFKRKGYRQISISGKELRKKLENMEPLDERIMRRPVAEILYDAYQES